MKDPTRPATVLFCRPSHDLRGGGELVLDRLATCLPAHGFRFVFGALYEGELRTGSRTPGEPVGAAR
jgi:hypothetical protein